MEVGKVMEFLNKIEEHFPVDQWQVNNIRIWPLLRIHLGYQLQYLGKEKNGYEKNRKVNRLYKLASGILKSAYAYFKDYDNNDKVSKNASAIFLSPNSARHFCSIKGYYDILCGPFIERLNKINIETLVLEFTSNFYSLPRDGKSIFIQNIIEYIKIKSRLLNRLGVNRKQAELCRYDEFVLFIKQSEYNVHVYSQTDLYREVLVIRYLADYFKTKLQKNNAKVGLAVCYYTYIAMAFNLACRELNITSVDIQHGTQGEDNFAYSKWNKVPNDGYELLPKIFWCWNDNDVSIIKRWADNLDMYHKPLMGGNLWIDIWKASSSNEMVMCYEEKIKEIMKPGKDTHLLYTMQTNQSLPPQIVKVIKESPVSWQWWIRLHPSMLNKRENIKNELYNLLGKDILIDEATNLPLPVLLRYMNLHLTEWSAVILEAEMMGVPSIAVNKWAEEFFSMQCSSGVLRVVYDSEPLMESIKEQMNFKFACNNEKSADYAFKYLMSTIRK